MTSQRKKQSYKIRKKDLLNALAKRIWKFNEQILQAQLDFSKVVANETTIKLSKPSNTNIHRPRNINPRKRGKEKRKCNWTSTVLHFSELRRLNHQRSKNNKKTKNQRRQTMNIQMQHCLIKMVENVKTCKNVMLLYQNQTPSYNLKLGSMKLKRFKSQSFKQSMRMMKKTVVMQILSNLKKSRRM